MKPCVGQRWLWHQKWAENLDSTTIVEILNIEFGSVETKYVQIVQSNFSGDVVGHHIGIDELAFTGTNKDYGTWTYLEGQDK